MTSNDPIITTPTNDTTPENEINREDIETYFEFLSPGESTVFCGCWFTEKSDRPISQYAVWYGDLAQILQTHKNLSEIGYCNPGFHLTLNETSDAGRREENIEAVRVLCLDIDDANDDVESVRKFILGTGVQLAVCSSKGKYHFYWALKRDISLEDWKVFQAGIAHRFKGDLNLSQIAHIIRVPGFPRISKSGERFVPRIVWAGERVELSAEGVRGLFVGIVEEGQKALEELGREQRAQSRRAMEAAKEAIAGVVTGETLKKVGAGIGMNGNRNSGLYQAVKVFCRKAGRFESQGKVEAIEYGKLLNQALASPLGEDEVRTLSIKAWRKAKKIRLKQEEIIHEAEMEIQRAGQASGEVSTRVDKSKSGKSEGEARGGSGVDKGDHEEKSIRESGEDRDAVESRKRKDPSRNQQRKSVKRNERTRNASESPRDNKQVEGSGRGEMSGKGKVRPNSSSERSGDQGVVGKKKKSGVSGVNGGKGEERKGPHFQYDYFKDSLGIERFSDSSVADRVLQRFKGKIVRVRGVIYAFDSKERTWHSQKGGATGGPTLLASFTKACAKDTILDLKFIRELCLDHGGNANPEAIKKWKRHFLSGHTRSSVLSLLQNENSYQKLTPTDFDANPEILFCKNGALNILTSELKEVRAKDYLLFCNNIDWNPDAQCPHWLKFLGEIFAGNDEPEEMLEFIQEVFGYSLSGSIEAQKMFVHWGTGSNGKSKMLETLALLMGEYSTRMNCKAFSKSKTGITKDVAKSTVKGEGKRVIVLDDLETKTPWDESLVKTFTADILPMEKKYHEEVDIPNRAKIHVACNEPPIPESENDAFVRRIYLISYHSKFEQNTGVGIQLTKTFKEELPGILAWAVKGYQKLASQDFKFSEPQQVLVNMSNYKQEHFKLTNILNELFEKAPIPKGDKGVVIKKIMKSDEDWHDINELTDNVSKAAENAHYYEPISIQWLSLHLKEQFQALKRRVRIGKKRVVQYRVKFIENGKGEL